MLNLHLHTCGEAVIETTPRMPLIVLCLWAWPVAAGEKITFSLLTVATTQSLRGLHIFSMTFFAIYLNKSKPSVGIVQPMI